MEDEQTCWICLCGTDGPDAGEDDQCVRVCACPRVCHKRCLGRWQLQNAGKKEEKYCRFCQQRYPDWRNSLTPGEITPSTPVMAVSVRGKVYKLRVRSGPEGKEDFKRQIRQLLGFTQDMDFDVIFECKTPHNGAEKVQLHGFEAFEAASWCAAVSAAKRKKAKQEAAARAAATAAASGGGGLTPMASCPAALTVPESSSRPSSSGSSTGAAAGSSGSSDGGSDVAPSGGQVDIDSSIAPSAFATATATAAVTGVTGCPSGTAAVSPLLASAVSDPQPALSSLTNSTSSHFGMFGLHPVPSHLLQTAGSSIPHAVIEEQQQTAAAAAAAVSPVSAATAAVAGGSRGSTRRSSSCPGERGGPGYPVSDGTSSGGHHHRGSYSSSGGLQTAMLVPSGSSSARSSRDGSSSQGDREDGGEGDKRGKMGRWLRRVLHLEGPWRGAMPAGVFMGVV